jgi:hypothetical protein
VKTQLFECGIEVKNSPVDFEKNGEVIRRDVAVVVIGDGENCDGAARRFAGKNERGKSMRNGYVGKVARVIVIIECALNANALNS